MAPEKRSAWRADNGAEKVQRTFCSPSDCERIAGFLEARRVSSTGPLARWWKVLRDMEMWTEVRQRVS
jgi:hypothetical protein